MKSQKGITLISLTVYVIVMIIVVGIIAVVSGAFFKSVKDANFYNDPLTEYTTFNSYFSDEVNHKDIQILECTENYVVFDNGVQYSFIKENRGIYRNKVKICWDIENCTFTESVENGKTVIGVHFESGGMNRTTSYTLR